MEQAETFSPEILSAKEHLRRAQEYRAKDLVGLLVDVIAEEAVAERQELGQLPREVLVEVTRQANIGYRFVLQQHGDTSPKVQRLKKERNIVSSLLTDLEKQEANHQADAWFESDF